MRTKLADHAVTITRRLISQIGVLAIAAICVDSATGQFGESYYATSGRPTRIVDQLSSGAEKVEVPIDRLWTSGFNCDPSGIDARYILLEYRRTVDMKPFYKGIYVMRLQATGTTNFMYMPLLTTHGVGQGPMSVMTNLPDSTIRRELRNMVTDNIDINRPEE